MLVDQEWVHEALKGFNQKKSFICNPLLQNTTAQFLLKNDTHSLSTTRNNPKFSMF
jgi:hypothetical protein